MMLDPALSEQLPEPERVPVPFPASSAGAGIRPLGSPPPDKIRGPGGRSALRTLTGSGSDNAGSGNSPEEPNP